MSRLLSLGLGSVASAAPVGAARGGRFGPSSGDASFNINKKWAAHYDEKKRKQDLSRARELGLFSADSGPVDSESDEDEDDVGEALTADVDEKIRETIAAIRNKDPRIYDKSRVFFPDEESKKTEGDDGAEPASSSAASGAGAGAGHKRKTAKDVLREQLVAAAESGRSDAFDEDEDVTLGRARDAADRSVATRAYDDEQKALRRAFLDTAADGGDGGDLLQVRKRAAPASAPAASRGARGGAASSVGSAAGREALREFLRRKDGAFASTAAELEDPNAFLEAFMQSNAWRQDEEEDDEDGEGDGDGGEGGDGGNDDDGSVGGPMDGADDGAASDAGSAEGRDRIARLRAQLDDVEEDEEELWRADEFESKYNFRFEEPGGDQIVTHARAGPADSLRRKETKRKDARDRKKDRKEEERAEAEAETRRLMNLKRTELKSRMGRIREIAGEGLSMDALALVLGDDLDADFDPEEYDRRMSKLFGDGYYAQGENEPLPADAALLEARAKAAAKQKKQAEKERAKKGKKEEGEGEDEEDDDEEEEEDTGLPSWVYGDGPRPTWAGPSAEEMAEGADDLGVDGLDAGAGEGEDGEEGEEEDGHDAAVHGRRRRREGRRKRESKKRLSTSARIKAALAADAKATRGGKPSGDGTRADDPDEVLALGFEDVIAGGLKTRFKYVQVPKADFGLTTEEILLADERDLNNYVGLKRIAPYRETEWAVPKKVRQRIVGEIRRKVEGEIEKLGLAKPNVTGGTSWRKGAPAAALAAAAAEEEEQGAAMAEEGQGDGEGTAAADTDADAAAAEGPSKKKRRRKHKHGKKGHGEGGREGEGEGEDSAFAPAPAPAEMEETAAEEEEEEEGGEKKKKRHRKRESGGGGDKQHKKKKDKSKKEKKDKRREEAEAVVTLASGVQTTKSRLASFGI
jgi:protein KRI1